MNVSPFERDWCSLVTREHHQFESTYEGRAMILHHLLAKGATSSLVTRLRPSSGPVAC
jgi:hypothetical protein